MNSSLLSRWFCGATFLAAASVLAVTPAELQQKLSAGENLTLIDVRPTALFAQGHIPNAINVPATLLPHKQLPPLGNVVVYDGGLDRDSAQAAATVLNAKPGIHAEVLEGGFAAWETAQSPTTRPGGMRHEEVPFITYAQLKRFEGEDLVLMDLRQAAASPKAPAGTTAARPLIDLQAEFPNARLAHSLAEALPNGKAQMITPAKPPLLVLIDRGDGAAQAMARQLKASGHKRFVILAGGEEGLVNQGRTGRARTRSSLPVPQAASVTNINR